jgi:fermentation-respiration switch protein FrsA (DUF1100 family)
METTVSPHSAPAARPRQRVRRVAASLAIGFVVLLLVAYIGISAFAADVLTTPRRQFSTTETPATFGLSYQDTRFPARGDDVSIAGWYIPRQGSDRAVILVHGKDSSRTQEFGGDFPDFAAALNQRGFSVLMIDMRGHGQSGDAHFSFGLNEQRDILGAVDWLESQGYRPGRIGLLGVSMGAASSILAAASDPAIGALVEDCGYAAIYPIIAQEWQQASGLPGFFLPSTITMGRLLYGYDLGASRPVDAIDEIAPRPVLIIHGTGDRLIPPDNADQLQEANPSAQVWKVPGAEHARSYGADPRAYVDQVAGFFERNLR